MASRWRSRINRHPRDAIWRAAGAHRPATHRCPHILQLASVIGRIFSNRLLANIAEQESLKEHLVILQREQLIRERARLPEAEYIFEHQLTLEAAYGGLLHRVRRVLHRRVAETMERYIRTVSRRSWDSSPNIGSKPGIHRALLHICAVQVCKRRLNMPMQKLLTI